MARARVTNVLIKAEATETRTLLNVRDLTTAFQDEIRRPLTAAGPIQTSYELLLRDWTTDSGEPGTSTTQNLRRSRSGSALTTPSM